MILEDFLACRGVPPGGEIGPTDLIGPREVLIEPRIVLGQTRLGVLVLQDVGVGRVGLGL
jgi:hypothetical protein